MSVTDTGTFSAGSDMTTLVGRVPGAPPSECPDQMNLEGERDQKELRSSSVLLGGEQLL